MTVSVLLSEVERGTFSGLVPHSTAVSTQYIYKCRRPIVKEKEASSSCARVAHAVTSWQARVSPTFILGYFLAYQAFSQGKSGSFFYIYVYTVEGHSIVLKF